MAEPTASSEAEPDDQQPVEEGRYRRLIRATLPRLTDEPPPRREPEFTIRNTQNARHGRFGKNAFRGHRPGAGGPMQGGANGNRPTGGGPRFAGSRPAGPGRGASGRGQSGGGGFRSPQHPRRGGGGKKRSR
jgi:hypothetical protein